MNKPPTTAPAAAANVVERAGLSKLEQEVVRLRLVEGVRAAWAKDF